VRQIKEELIKEKGLEKATEEYIDALYYYQMYFSAACWKTDPKIVATELKKLTSENMIFCIERKHNDKSEGDELGMVPSCLVKGR